MATPNKRPHAVRSPGSRPSTKPGRGPPRGAPKNKEPPSGPPCLVCGQPTSQADSTLCLACVKKNETPRRPRFEGGARTEHGTRVARAVVCVRCGKEDHVAFKPRESEKVMCRACTEEVAGRNEHGDLKKPLWKDIVCAQCGKKARLPLRVAAKPRVDLDGKILPPICQDCFLGIETNPTSMAERRRPGVLLKRKNG